MKIHLTTPGKTIIVDWPEDEIDYLLTTTFDLRACLADMAERAKGKTGAFDLLLVVRPHQREKSHSFPTDMMPATAKNRRPQG